MSFATLTGYTTRVDDLLSFLASEHLPVQTMFSDASDAINYYNRQNRILRYGNKEVCNIEGSSTQSRKVGVFSETKRRGPAYLMFKVSVFGIRYNLMQHVSILAHSSPTILIQIRNEYACFKISGLGKHITLPSSLSVIQT